MEHQSLVKRKATACDEAALPLSAGSSSRSLETGGQALKLEASEVQEREARTGELLRDGVDVGHDGRKAESWTDGRHQLLRDSPRPE
jgi:hypothetical protein